MLTGAFKNYVKLLRALHWEIGQGRGDGAEADRIRDAMDRPWNAMTATERELTRQLSADLYELNDATPKRGGELNDRDMQEGLDAVKNAFAQQQWESVLLEVRNVDPLIPAAIGAFFRGRAWSELGDVDTALLFFEHASKLDPDNVNYRYLTLDLLAKSSRAPEAEARAREILQRLDEFDVRIGAKAADILFIFSRKLDDAAASQLYRRLIDAYEQLLARATSAGDEKKPILVQMLVTQGLCYEHLGDDQTARITYDDAIALDPDNEPALVARGMMLYGTDPQSIKDFMKAIELQSVLVWPFFFLAHDALLRGQYQQCLQLSKDALKRQSSAAVKADLYEMAAISVASSDGSPDIAREWFNLAARLAPTNPRIEKNLEIFRGTISATLWEIPPVEAAREFGHAEYLNSASTVAA
jgi:tetratricopeptide (TPR) repeat protein